MDSSAFVPAGTPAQWSVYFGAEDAEGADVTLDRIVKLGGTVLRPAEDTPYGRLAEAADPMGARFKLVSPNEMMPAKS